MVDFKKLNDELKEKRSIPKCGNCEEFADKCTCWDEVDVQTMLSWRIKHGYLKSDLLASKLIDPNEQNAVNCEKHKRMIVALLDPDTKKEKGYCIECIRELEEEIIEAPDCDNCEEKMSDDPPDHSWRD